MADLLATGWAAFADYCEARRTSPLADVEMPSPAELQKAMTCLALMPTSNSPLARTALSRLYQLPHEDKVEALFLSTQAGGVHFATLAYFGAHGVPLQRVPQQPRPVSSPGVSRHVPALPAVDVRARSTPLPGARGVRFA